VFFVVEGSDEWYLGMSYVATTDITIYEGDADNDYMVDVVAYIYDSQGSYTREFYSIQVLPQEEFTNFD